MYGGIRYVSFGELFNCKGGLGTVFEHGEQLLFADGFGANGLDFVLHVTMSPVPERVTGIYCAGHEG